MVLSFSIQQGALPVIRHETAKRFNPHCLQLVVRSRNCHHKQGTQCLSLTRHFSADSLNQTRYRFRVIKGAMAATGTSAHERPEVLVVGQLMDKIEAELEELFTCHKLYNATDQDALLAEVGPRVRGIATTGPAGASAALIKRLPQLEIVSCWAVGTDSVDVQLCKERGIAVTNTPDVLSECVADLAFGLLLATMRRLVVGDRFVRERKWLSGDFPFTRRVWGKRMGIVGLGSIGMAVARRALAFQMSVAYHNRRKRDGVDFQFYESAVDLAKNVDILVLVCPLTPSTRHLVGRAVLDALGPEGCLINIARGPVVDEAELVAALQEGRLGAAGLDVFEDEPRVPSALMGMEQVVLQPHVGSATEETRYAMGRLVVDNLQAKFDGKPLLTPL